MSENHNDLYRLVPRIFKNDKTSLKESNIEVKNSTLNADKAFGKHNQTSVQQNEIEKIKRGKKQNFNPQIYKNRFVN